MNKEMYTMRKQFEKISLQKQKKEYPSIKINKLFDWNKAIINKNECGGHGIYTNKTYGNIEYIKYLENLIRN